LPNYLVISARVGKGLEIFSTCFVLRGANCSDAFGTSTPLRAPDFPNVFVILDYGRHKITETIIIGLCAGCGKVVEHYPSRVILPYPGPPEPVWA
jgi:hypothetical protein